jgi:hypothetical protein
MSYFTRNNIGAKDPTLAEKLEKIVKTHIDQLVRNQVREPHYTDDELTADGLGTLHRKNADEKRADDEFALHQLRPIF